jgi:hypothetical protein
VPGGVTLRMRCRQLQQPGPCICSALLLLSRVYQQHSSRKAGSKQATRTSYLWTVWTLHGQAFFTPALQCMQVRSVCEAMPHTGCELCLPSWEKNATWGNCDLLKVYGSVCGEMPGT